MRNIIVALSVFAQKALAEKCRALVMSGGGANGAWEAGVIWGLAHYGDPGDYQWDVVTGISAGGINSVLSVGFWPFEVMEMTQYVSDTWRNMTNSDIWVHRSGTPGEIIENNPSYLDSSPGEASIREWMSRSKYYKKLITLGCTDINTGEFLEFTESNTSYYDMAKVSIASCSVPTILPPVEFDGHLLVDGGQSYDINISSAIKQCHELGATNEEITVDLTYWLLRPEPGANKVGTTIPNYLNARETKFYYTGMNSVDLQVRAASGVNFRHYFQEPISELEFRMF